MKATKVPNDLLPLHPAHLKSNNWAAKTFVYWNAFHVGTLPQVPGEEDLSNWRDAAADIIEELKALGVSKAQKKICNMVNSYYTFDYKNTSFNTLYDVVDMLSDPAFYSENMDLVRDMLHMFQYGIFRTGYNGWAHECANEWMHERNIQYLHLNTGKKARTGKGFVYKLIVTRASGSLCERLQNMSQRLYREYVVVRDRKVKKYGDNYVMENYVFNYRFQGYLCKFKDINNEKDNDNHKDTEIAKITSIVKEAKANGMSFEEIYNVIQNALTESNNVCKYKNNNYIFVL